jgi:hypothetical protein
MLKEDKERMRSLVTETLTLLCKNGLSFNKQFTLNALIGINLDSDKEFHFIVSETFSNALEENSTTKVANPDSGDSSDESQSSSESDTDDDNSDEKGQRKPLVKLTTVKKMHDAVMFDLECQNSDEVHVKTEPHWDRSKLFEESPKNRQSNDHHATAAPVGHWRVMENRNQNSSKPKIPKFIPITDHSDTLDMGSATWQQFAALIPDGPSGDNNQDILDEVKHVMYSARKEKVFY